VESVSKFAREKAKKQIGLSAVKNVFSVFLLLFCLFPEMAPNSILQFFRNVEKEKEKEKEKERLEKGEKSAFFAFCFLKARMKIFWAQLVQKELYCFLLFCLVFVFLFFLFSSLFFFLPSLFFCSFFEFTLFFLFMFLFFSFLLLLLFPSACVRFLSSSSSFHSSSSSVLFLLYLLPFFSAETSQK